MVCQQLGGINGVCFYTSSIFELAGTMKIAVIVTLHSESLTPSYFLSHHHLHMII